MADAKISSFSLNCPVPRVADDRIVLAHGGGGRLTHQLIEKIFMPAFSNDMLEQRHDGAVLPINGSRLAFTTDSFVVRPLIFPGGTIGDLAVFGTVNDLAMCGARPLYLSAGFILEEGLEMDTLRTVVTSMQEAAAKANVKLVTGDTKVVEHGKADSMYITTTGIGRPIQGLKIDPRSVRAGDKILLSGPIGDHGITILLARGELDLEADLHSDTRSVLPLVEALAHQAGPAVRWMRDPTRGGVATSLNELARDCGLGIVLMEEMIPVRDAVRGACELLGLDPLHIANEGQFLAVIAPEYADAALSALNSAPGGPDTQIIGEVREQPSGAVLVTTRYGGSRIVDMLVGDPLPRIC